MSFIKQKYFLNLVLLLGSFFALQNGVNAQCDVNNPYDKIVSGYHASIALKTNGVYSVWGASMKSDGGTDQLVPQDIDATNYPGLTGTIIKAAIGGQTSGTSVDQGILLTTTGLWAWGIEGVVLKNTLTSSSALARIAYPSGAQSTGLPAGVSPTDIKAMFATFQTLLLLTNAGNVWVLTQTSLAVEGNGGTSSTVGSSTWKQIKTDALHYLDNVKNVRGQVSGVGYNAFIAETSSGQLYTWGNTTFLGNSTTASARNYATLMTLPVGFTASDISMIGVTGGDGGTSVANTYYLLSNNGNLYSLGDNKERQCGDFTTIDKTAWVRVQKSATANDYLSNIKYISSQEHNSSYPAAAAITTSGELYTWGSNSKNMLGRPVDGDLYNPGVPDGFTSGDKALFVEVGGHTIVYAKLGSAKFCYVGHRIQGSMGDNTSASATEASFNCTSTPTLDICGSVPVAADHTKSTISASPNTIAASGTSTSTITVQLKNASNVNLTTTGGTVVIFSNKGTIGTVTDNNDGTYTSILTSSSNVESATISYTINVTAATATTTVNFISSGGTPTITKSGTLSAFVTCVGTASAAQSFSVTASDLTTDLTVTAPTGYQVSTSQTGTYSNTLTVAASSGTISATDIWVRLTGVSAGNYTGTVSCTSTGATTQTVALTGITGSSVGGTISGSSVVTSGTNTTTLTLTGYSGTIQWKSSIDNITYNILSGATSATYTASNIAVTTYYKAVVTNTGCGTSATTSSTGIITVNQLNIPGTITGGDVTVCAGAANSTTLTLSGAIGSIQWQVSTDNITFTDITGATTSTYVAVNLNATKYYRTVVSSGACSSAISASVVITASQCIVANPDINATMVNTLVSGSVNTNDKTTSGTIYTTGSASSANPSGATLTMNTNGSYTFTALLPGKYIYFVNVCASGQTTGCAIATLEISVTDPNSTTNPPLAKNDYSTLQVNTPAVVKVLSNDKVGNPGTLLLPSTMTVSSAPINGTAAVNTTTGVITFTPNTGFTGTDSLNYNVCDNSSPSNCQVATVYFKVSSNAVLEYTTADDDFNTVNMNSSVTGNVLSNDINSLGNALTVTSNTAPLSTQGAISINADGSYTFTPTANFFGPIDITYTACSSTSACAIATLHILVVPVKLAPPKPINGTYTTGASTNPATIASTVTNISSGSKVIYCNVSGLSCATTAPALPTIPGIYVWCVKSLDTLTGLTSDPCVYDTLRILPKLTTKNATYLTGVVANPANISGLVTTISTGSVPKWCDVSGLTCSTTAPTLPTATGTYIWCVKAVDVVSGLVSASCVMDTVTILAPYSVLEISKTSRAVKSNPDGSFLVTFAMKATNKTDVLLDSVTIKDNLAKTFNAFSGITVYSLETFGGLIKNSGYDGISNIDLVSSQSKINPKTTDSLILKVLVASTNISGSFLNTSVLGGKSKYGVIAVQSNDPSVNANDSTKRAPSPFVVPKTDVIIAGGFSPNQDGINDKWVIVRPYGTTIEVKVFNRWGNIVYQNADYKNDWTGRGENNFSGDYVPEGTYFYTVNAIDRSGAIKKFTSSLTIVR